MITTTELDKSQSFGKESENEYSDRHLFTIIRKRGDEWFLFFFNEVDGSLYFIKTLKDMDDLKNVYKAITNQELI